MNHDNKYIKKKRKLDWLIIIAVWFTVFLCSPFGWIAILSVNCAVREKMFFKENPWPTADELKGEIEKKWGIEVQQLSFDTDKTTLNAIYRTQEGIEFNVCGNRNFYFLIGNHERNGFTDNYNNMYVKKHADEVFAELNAEGWDIIYNDEWDDTGNVCYANISQYEDFDRWSEIDTSFLVMQPVMDTYIISDEITSIKFRHGDCVLEDTGNYSYEEGVRWTYVDMVRNGEIDEKLSEEVLHKYYARSLTVYVDGEENAFCKNIKPEYTKIGVLFFEFNIDCDYNEGKNFLTSCSELEAIINVCGGEITDRSLYKGKSYSAKTRYSLRWKIENDQYEMCLKDYDIVFKKNGTPIEILIRNQHASYNEGEIYSFILLPGEVEKLFPVHITYDCFHDSKVDFTVNKSN